MRDAERFLGLFEKSIADIDFEAYIRLVSLPYSVMFDDVTEIRAAREDVEADFVRICVHRHREGITRVDRSVLGVQHIGDAMKGLTHSSQAYNDRKRVRGPYTSLSLLRRRTDDWQVTCLVLPFLAPDQFGRPQTGSGAFE